MFLIWHGSIVRALNRISSKFPLGLLGKTLAQQGKIHGPGGLGFLAFQAEELPCWVRHLLIGGYVYLKHHRLHCFTPMLKVDDIK